MTAAFRSCGLGHYPINAALFKSNEKLYSSWRDHVSDGLVRQVPFDNEDEEENNNIEDWDDYEALPY